MNIPYFLPSVSSPFFLPSRIPFRCSLPILPCDLGRCLFRFSFLFLFPHSFSIDSYALSFLLAFSFPFLYSTLFPFCCFPFLSCDRPFFLSSSSLCGHAQVLLLFPLSFLSHFVLLTFCQLFLRLFFSFPHSTLCYLCIQVSCLVMLLLCLFLFPLLPFFFLPFSPLANVLSGFCLGCGRYPLSNRPRSFHLPGFGSTFWCSFFPFFGCGNYRISCGKNFVLRLSHWHGLVPFLRVVGLCFLVYR